MKTCAKLDGLLDGNMRTRGAAPVSKVVKYGCTQVPVCIAASTSHNAGAGLGLQSLDLLRSVRAHIGTGEPHKAPHASPLNHKTDGVRVAERTGGVYHKPLAPIK